MDITKPLRLHAGDMSGTPIAMVEGRRAQGALVLWDAPEPHIPPRSASTALIESVAFSEIDYRLVWGETAQRQTGYAKAVVLKDRRVVLCAPLSDEDLALVGGRLPQDPSGHTNADEARAQRAAREARLAPGSGAALEHVERVFA